ncbi:MULTISPECIES: hypothetical protein [Bacillus]|nr:MULTISPECIES: hypothetical protein [Bacillus]MEC4200413.1 hypothetical protein [Bacillus sp. AAVF1]
MSVELFLSSGTVQNYISGIMHKMNGRKTGRSRR